MNDFPLSAGITLLIVLLMFWTAYEVGMGRKRYDVKAPAVTGHPMFERAYRVQMNTLEWVVMTLPCLWLCAVFVSDAVAAGLGVVWLLGRVWYALAYRREPSLRGPGFLVGALAFGALGVAGAAGVALRLLA